MERPARIMLIDDEPEMLSACTKILKAFNYQPFPVNSGAIAIQLLQEEEYDLILCDLLMPEVDGMKVLQANKKYAPNTPFVIFTAYGTVDRAVRAMHEGAFDFIEKPFETDYLKVVIEKALYQRGLYQERNNLLQQLENRYSFDNIIGKSSVMRRIFTMVESIAKSESNVLITGESGTGKELIARSIHTRSLHKTKPFVPVNCGAFPENLFEAELFGYEKGAFTGANKRKIGLLEYANNGTFFLDEVCELPLSLQTKLLRVIQDQLLRHIGGNELIQTNLRLISATNRDINKIISEGVIREDFYYRINVINIHLPPLRERKEDIRLLAEHFLKNSLKSSSKDIKGFDKEVLLQMEKYNWPGNVRELENIVERAVALANNEIITIKELPLEMQIIENNQYAFDTISLAQARRQAIEDVEKKYLLFLLKKHRGHVTNISKEAGMTRRNIHNLLNRHKIDANNWR